MNIPTIGRGTQLALLPHDGRTRAVHASEEHDVYAGRVRGVDPRAARPGVKGWLGNPHPVGAPCPACGGAWHEGDEALRLFEAYFRARVESEPDFQRAVLALKGKRLGCPGCATGAPCHARVIAEYVERQHAAGGAT